MVDTTAESHNKLDPLHFTLDQRESVGAGRRMVLTLNEIQTMAKDNPYVELIVMRDQPILQCEKFDYTRDPRIPEVGSVCNDGLRPRRSFLGKWKMRRTRIGNHRRPRSPRRRIFPAETRKAPKSRILRNRIPLCP